APNVFAPNVFAPNVFAPDVFAAWCLPGFFGDSVFRDAVFGADGFLGLVLGDLGGLLAAIAFFIVSLACLDFPAGFLDLVGCLPGDLEAFFLAEGCLSLGKGTGISGANAIEERDLGGKSKGRF
ncbi:MAG: hypothetical protein ACKN9U_11605, partial [Pirellulaceae bacterium]